MAFYHSKAHDVLPTHAVACASLPKDYLHLTFCPLCATHYIPYGRYEHKRPLIHGGITSRSLHNTSERATSSPDYMSLLSDASQGDEYELQQDALSRPERFSPFSEYSTAIQEGEELRHCASSATAPPQEPDSTSDIPHHSTA